MNETKHYLSYYNDDYSTIRIEKPSGEVLCILDDERDVDIITDELNTLNDSIEFWKQSALSNASLNDIVLNELDIARKQGYEVSDPFKRLMELDKND